MSALLHVTQWVGAGKKRFPMDQNGFLFTNISQNALLEQLVRSKKGAGQTIMHCQIKE